MEIRRHAGKIELAQVISRDGRLLSLAEEEAIDHVYPVLGGTAVATGASPQLPWRRVDPGRVTLVLVIVAAALGELLFAVALGKIIRGPVRRAPVQRLRVARPVHRARQAVVGRRPTGL